MPDEEFKKWLEGKDNLDCGCGQKLSDHSNIKNGICYYKNGKSSKQK